MNQHRHNRERRASGWAAEPTALADFESAMVQEFGPFPANGRIDDPSAAEALGARIAWLADRLGLPIERDGTLLAMNVVHRAGIDCRTRCDAVCLALLALTLDRLDQPNGGCHRTIQRDAHREGLVLSASDVAYHLRSRALDEWREGSLLATCDGFLDLDIDGWILAAGRAMVAEKVALRTDGEADVLADLLPRFGAFLGARWTNTDHELRQEMLQEGAIRLLRTERSRNLEEEADNPDGYRFQVIVNRARSEFDRDRRRRDRTAVINDDSHGDERLSHVDDLPDYTENPVDMLRAAASAGGPIEQLLALRPRSVHGPTLLGHLRRALDAGLREETRLVVEMERNGAFGSDRTKDGSAALNRVVWAAAHRRDPAEYPADDVNTEHRPMKRVRRFVEEFVSPCLGVAGSPAAA